MVECPKRNNRGGNGARVTDCRTYGKRGIVVLVVRESWLARQKPSVIRGMPEKAQDEHGKESPWTVLGEILQGW
jgi:hypothetical protein